MRDRSNTVKIRHTANAKERLEQAHLIMGISNRLGSELEEIFNNWSKTRITDDKLKELIQLAMVPNKEVLDKIQKGNEDETSTYFKNMCNSVFEYAVTSPSQQLDTTKGTLFGAYNAVTGFFQNAKVYKDSEAKLKSLLFGGSSQMKVQKCFQLCSNLSYLENANFLRSPEGLHFHGEQSLKRRHKTMKRSPKFRYWTIH